MKVKDLRKKTLSDLNKHALKLRQKLADEKREQLLSDNKNNKRFRNTKRELSRTLTLIREQQLKQMEKTDE